jgi:hypothetical protein
MNFNKSKRLLFKLAWSTIVIVAVYKLKYFEKSFFVLSHSFDKPLTDLNANDFYRLSQDLLGETELSLSRDLSNRIWNQLNNIGEIKEKFYLLLSEYKRSKISHQKFEITEEFSTVHKAAIRTVLIFWYTGVFKYQTLPQERFFYEEALMHSNFYSIRPAPGNCGGTFGYWAKPPEQT